MSVLQKVTLLKRQTAGYSNTKMWLYDGGGGVGGGGGLNAQ